MPVFEYDVALSFAGEDRDYVQAVADALHQLDITVFYDKYEQVDLWGKDLYAHLDEIFRKKSRYCVMFGSRHYKAKLWTNHERVSAQARAFDSDVEYILPVRFDDTEIPGLRPTTGNLDIEGQTPQQIAYLIAEEIGADAEIKEMIAYIVKWYQDAGLEFEATVNGTELELRCESEDACNSFPLRLMLEMYRADELERLFLRPGIMPC